MSFKKKLLPLALAQVIAGGAFSALSIAPAMAQEASTDAAAPVQRVEITGSSIKRINKEGASPIQILTQDDIKKTGATSVTDLIQALPAMQGFVPASSSVNGGGGGATTAALHSLQSKYTLVLLDGQRMAPVALGASQGGGFGVNLESIPLDAIERVEILTDGASALYGSDAIAGVVNFITKKNKTDGNVFFNDNTPQHPGGRSYNTGISKGFGDLETDGYNVLLSYSHDYQGSVLASQRGFSASGAYFPFSYGGNSYIFNQRTSNTEPANLTFSTVPTGSPAGTATTSHTINPYYTANGNCGSPLAGVLISSADSTSCRFNYAATVEDIPSTVRDSGLVKGTFKINADTTLWTELVLSRVDLKSQYAPSAQPLGVNATTRFPSLYNTYLAPYLAANNETMVGNATLGYRTVSMGGRADDYITDATHFVVGLDGQAMGWSYKANLTLSHSNIKDNAAGGYTDDTQLEGLVASGAYNPVSGAGSSSLIPALLNGTTFTTTNSDFNTLHLGAQHDLFAMDGGTSILSLGGEYQYQHYRVSDSPLILSQSGFSTQPASSDFPIGGGYGAVPFDASRNNYGIFGEWLLPVTKTLEATLSGRYDSYSKTYSKDNFSTSADPVTGLQDQLANGDVGNTFSAGTYKASFRWTPVDTLLFRGAYGTGFKAPNMTDLAGPITYAGSTSGTYACPFPGSVGCLPGSAQYDLLAGANGLSGANGLAPEKSKQWTLGFVFEPVKGLSLGADLWHVQITNQVLSSGIAEQVAFSNPQAYKGLFVNPYQDPAGFQTIALEQLPLNGGVAHYEGLDWDVGYHTNTSIGKLATSWTGTYMMKQDYTNSPGGAVLTDLGVYGPDQAVVFRTQMHLTTSLQTGAWTNTVVANYKSGYKDESYVAGTDIYLNNNGALGASVNFPGLDVPSYTTFDWQAKYVYNKAFVITGGIKNLFDRDPPLTLQSGGGGNQIGYDGRYADPFGRTFYLGGNYKF